MFEIFQLTSSRFLRLQQFGHEVKWKHLLDKDFLSICFENFEVLLSDGFYTFNSLILTF